MPENLPAAVPMGERGLTPTDIDQQWRMSVAYYNSGMTPFKSPEQCFVAVQKCLELGLPSSTITDSIAVVNGKATVYGKAAKAVVRAHPMCEDMQESVEGEGDALAAVCRIKRSGCGWTEARFSVADAKVARLWGKSGVWSSYPKDMLGYKAFARCAATAIPEALAGIHVKEDIEDVPFSVSAPVRPSERRERGSDPLLAALTAPPGVSDPELEGASEMLSEPLEAGEPEEGLEPDPDPANEIPDF